METRIIIAVLMVIFAAVFFNWFSLAFIFAAYVALVGKSGNEDEAIEQFSNDNNL